MLGKVMFEKWVKRTKRIGCASLLCFAAMCSSTAEAREYIIDPQATTVSFQVRQFGMAEQTGEFDKVTGKVMLDAAGDSRLEIALDSRSVRASNNAAEHILRGRGMLDVEQFPLIVYSASRIAIDDGKPQHIEGMLTLRGVTRPVSLDVETYVCTTQVFGERCSFTATTSFRRSEFGMNGFIGFVSDRISLAILGVAQSDAS
jgi:polyisoprenoid-binding protein YceI